MEYFSLLILKFILLGNYTQFDIPPLLSLCFLLFLPHYSLKNSPIYPSEKVSLLMGHTQSLAH